VADVAVQADALLPLIPADRRQFYQGHLLTQARINLRSLDMLARHSQAPEAYAKGNGHPRKNPGASTAPASTPAACYSSEARRLSNSSRVSRAACSTPSTTTSSPARK